MRGFRIERADLSSPNLFVEHHTAHTLFGNREMPSALQRLPRHDGNLSRVNILHMIVGRSVHSG